MSAKRPISLGRTYMRRDWRVPNTRRGNLVRLVLYLAAAALVGHWQASRPAGRMLVQEGVSMLTAPVLTGLSAVASAVHDAATVLPRAGEVAAENRKLKRQVEEMQRRNASLAEDSLENERLRALLKLRSALPRHAVAAAVVGRQLTRWPTALVIDKGRADGIRPRQPVVAAGGLVGRIYSVSAHSAVAIPLIDRNSSAGATVQRSRSAGILEGDGEQCRLNYLPLYADVKPGDVVISSGLGGIFPKGIMIGTIEGVSRDDATAVKSAVVRPSVDLSRLEEVLVIGNAPEAHK